MIICFVMKSTVKTDKCSFFWSVWFSFISQCFKKGLIYSRDLFVIEWVETSYYGSTTPSPLHRLQMTSVRRNMAVLSFAQGQQISIGLNICVFLISKWLSINRFVDLSSFDHFTSSQTFWLIRFTTRSAEKAVTDLSCDNINALMIRWVTTPNPRVALN